MEHKKKIMLIPPIVLPIPAVGGGAVEQLVTHLLDENEIQQKVEFVVVAKYHPDAEKKEYKHSKIYYIDDEDSPHEELFHIKKKYKLYLLGRKVFKNHLTIKFFPQDIHYMDFFMYQCYRIAKKEKVNFVVNENRWNSDVFDIFNYKLGRDRVFYHLHYTREEDIATRKIISNSISISNYVRENWVVNSEIKGKNVVLYNGIDIAPFKETFGKQKCLELRSKMRLTEKDFVVIFCGRIIPEKGVEQLLNAFEKLEKINFQVKLVMIGSVGFSEGTVTDFSERIVKKATELSNVRYLGYISNKEMPKYYAAADIQIVPSVWQEGAGLVTVEGMASGLPLIVTRSGGMIEYVDSECSVQLAIDDKLSDHIVEAILELAEHPERCKSMSKYGRDRAELYTKEKYYTEFVNIFQY